jgi:DNA (cytosine-5)-methyltransferase 1
VSAFYNENDPYAARWLGNLIDAGHIASGVVSAKSIVDLVRADLAGFRQAHFFAGVGVWSAALRAAGWPDSRRVWTGSCPCQPFSGAGKGHGFNDKRHLWPAWFWLIEQHRPDILFGEQVERSAGRAWLDLVFTDLEGLGYSCGATVFPAAGVGAPHGRHRTYWLAYANQGQRGRLPSAKEREPDRQAEGWPQSDGGAADDRGAGGLADTERVRRRRRQPDSDVSERPEKGRSMRLVADRIDAKDRSGAIDGFWRDPDWIFCRDDKWRPIESGLEPLAHGARSRVGRLRAYGNAIVLQQAQAFIEAFLELEAAGL